MTGLGLLRQARKDRKVLFVGLKLTGCKEEILGEIAVIVGSMGSSLIPVMSYKEDMGTGGYQDLCGAVSDGTS